MGTARVCMVWVLDSMIIHPYPFHGILALLPNLSHQLKCLRLVMKAFDDALSAGSNTPPAALNRCPSKEVGFYPDVVAARDVARWVACLPVP